METFARILSVAQILLIGAWLGLTLASHTDACRPQPAAAAKVTAE